MKLLSKYLMVTLLTGCTVSANVDTNSYDCADSKKEAGDFIIECSKEYRIERCLSASKSIFCKRITNSCNGNDETTK